VGGSYAGALSAWMRYKFPHLVQGAISSSGVVRSILDFYQLEEQIRSDLEQSGEKCVNVVKEFEKYAQEQMLSGDSSKIHKFLEIFNAHDLDLEVEDFMYFFADLYTTEVQYGKRRAFCKFLDEMDDGLPIEEKLKKLGVLAKESSGVTPEKYTFDNILNTTIDFKKQKRQWTYQYCSSYAWFQTASPEESKRLRWIGMDLDYWRSYCQKAFDHPLYPNTKHTNFLSGGYEIGKHASNIFFSQGSDDPWKWAGIQFEEQVTQDSLEVGIIDCEDCGHCTDLHAAKDDDPAILKEIRQREIAAIKKWLKVTEPVEDNVEIRKTMLRT
jgi:hypothetical protein